MHRDCRSTWSHFPNQLCGVGKLKLPILNLDQAPISSSHPHSLTSQINAFFNPLLSFLLICLLSFFFFLYPNPLDKTCSGSIKANALVSSWHFAIAFHWAPTAGIRKPSLTGSVLHLGLGTTLGQV